MKLNSGQGLLFIAGVSFLASVPPAGANLELTAAENFTIGDIAQSPSVWQLLGRMLAYAPHLYALDSLLWLFIQGLPAIPGLIIREFFNRLTQQSTLNLSPQALILILLAVGFARILSIFSGRITKTQHRFVMSSLLRRNLFSLLLQQPGAQQTASTGELISYFREDVSQIQDNVVGTNEIFGQGVFAVAALLILLSVNASLTSWVFLPIVATAFVIQQAQKRIKHYRRRSRQATQQVTGLIGEIFNAVQAIQVAVAENSVLSHFNRLNEQRAQRMVQDQVFNTSLNSLLENLTTLGTGLILLVVALSLSNSPEAITLGDFALFVYYLFFVSDFLWFLGSFIALSKQTEVAFERLTALSSNPLSAYSLVAPTPLYLQNIWGHKPPLPPLTSPPSVQPLQRLSVQNLTYYYPESHQGIENISLTLERGSFTVITGRIGSGKTTLLRVLLGLLPRQAGVIQWNNQVI